MSDKTKMNIWDFEEVKACMICGSEDQAGTIGLSWDGVGFSYTYCKSCGLKYMNPRPTAESYQKFYIDSYWQERMTATGPVTGTVYDDPNVDQLKLRMPKYKSVYRKVKRDIQSIMDITPETKILEVGCAFGFTLEWLKRDFSCQVYGIEPSELSVKRCLEGGVNIVGDTAENYFFNDENLKNDNKFDVIFFRHVLAQIVDVKSLVTRIKEFLKPEGTLIIYTPNDYYFNLTDPYHVNIFTPETLSNFVNSCGYEVIKMVHSPDPKSKEIALKVQPSYEVICFSRPSQNAKLEVKNPDIFELIEMGKMGKRTYAWQSLAFKDLIYLVSQRIKKKLGL